MKAKIWLGFNRINNTIKCVFEADSVYSKRILHISYILAVLAVIA